MTALLTDDAQRLWRAAQALNRAAAAVSPAAGRLPPLLFFTDPARTPRPWEMAARLPAGAGVVFRHFGAADALDQALRLRQATRAAGVRLLIGLDADLAQAVEADGVHLPERALSAAFALSAQNPAWLLTGAAHSIKTVRTARDLHAAVLSPVFQAGGASSSRSVLGLEGLAGLIEAAPCPAYALGGVTVENAAMMTGVCGLAAVESIARAFGSETIRT